MGTRLILQILLLVPCIRAQDLKQPDCSWSIEENLGKWTPCKQCNTTCRCLTQTVGNTEQTMVSCTNAGLRNVPTCFPNTTVFLDLSANNIKSLGVQKFKNYKNLVNLTIAHNQLTGVERETFEGLHKLVCLSLRNNSIRYNIKGFQPQSFRPLASLKILNIQQSFNITGNNNYIEETYNLDALYDLSSLQELYLDGFAEKSLGEVFKNLTSLKKLTFNGTTGRCVLRELTREFFPPNTSLTHITVYNCTLERVQPKSFQQLTQLLYLDLSNNENLTLESMSNITDGLQFTKIETLKLNKIHGLFGSCVVVRKENVRGLSNLTLKEIFLESNRITTMEINAPDYLPLSLEVISVKDNKLMLDAYVFSFLARMLRSNIRRFIVADQFTNHNIPKHLQQRNSVERNNIGRKIPRDDFKIPTNRYATAKYAKTENTERNLDAIDPKHRHSNTSSYIKRHSTESNPKYSRTNKDRSIKDEINVEKIISQVSDDSAVPIRIPSTLSYLDASNVKIRLTIEETIFELPNNLTEVDLSKNLFWNWKGPILGVKNLSKLDLSWNFCTEVSLIFFQNMINLQFLNLSKNFLGDTISKDTKGILFKNQTQLEILDLSENRLTELPKSCFKNLYKLTTLHLARNLLKRLQTDLSHMKALKVLTLNDNQLTTIPKHLRDFFDHQTQITSFSLDLDINNFKCNCQNLDFLKWISESPVKFENKRNYVCYYDNETVGNLSNADVLYRTLKSECYNHLPVIVICTAAVVLISSLTGSAVIYRYRWNIRYMYYMAKYKSRGKKLDPRGYAPITTAENEIRDVNVSYADEDSGFVAQRLFPELQANRGLTLYIRDRHAPVDGRYICDNILDAIESTRKTLIVMSEAYLQHDWCVFEMNMANIKALKTDDNILCVLMLEAVQSKDLPLKVMKIIKDRECLEYPGPEDLHDLFWDRLHDICTN